jgi:hypothetical protein
MLRESVDDARAIAIVASWHLRRDVARPPSDRPLGRDPAP